MSNRAEVPAPAQIKGRVLIVEDTTTIRFAIQCMLELIGFDVDCAINGQEAVEMTAVSQYFLVLMDVEMPVMDGIAATKEIRSCELMDVAAPLRIIGISGHIDRGIKSLCQSAGMDDVLPKPFSVEQLQEKIAAVTG